VGARGRTYLRRLPIRPRRPRRSLPRSRRTRPHRPAVRSGSMTQLTTTPAAPPPPPPPVPRSRALPKILFVDHTAALGGGEIALLNLIQHLDTTRHRPVVLLFSDGDLADKLRKSGVECHVLPLDPAALHTR